MTDTPTQPPPFRALDEGWWPQIYLDSIEGHTPTDRRDAYLKLLDTAKDLGCPGVVDHGFCHDLPERFDDLAAPCAERGLQCAASFGLDDSAPEYKGQRIGSVAKRPHCAAGILDAEGMWERMAADLGRATALEDALHETAPNALLGDQPWPEARYHAQWPWVQFARYLAFRAAQYYVNDWIKQWGSQRYKHMWPEFDRQWDVLTRDVLAPHNAVRPRIHTIEGYRWADILADLVHCLLHHRTLIIWCEPNLSPSTILAMRAVRRLQSLGFYDPSKPETADTAVLAFQRDYNRTAKTKLDEDGRCGPLTIAALMPHDTDER